MTSSQHLHKILLIICFGLNGILPAYAASHSSATNTHAAPPIRTTLSKPRIAALILGGISCVALGVYLIHAATKVKNKRTIAKPVVLQPDQDPRAIAQSANTHTGPVQGPARKRIDDATGNIPSQEAIRKYFNELESFRQNNRDYQNITVCDRGNIYREDIRWFVIFFKDLETSPIKTRPTDKDQNLKEQKAFVSYYIADDGPRESGKKRIVIDTLYTDPAHTASKQLLIKQLIIEANNISASSIDFSVKTPDLEDFIAQINFYTQFGARFFVTPIFRGGYYICAYIKPSDFLSTAT